MRHLCILLFLSLNFVSTAYAELPNWKEGDVIKAELITSFYKVYLAVILVTQENEHILLTLDPDDNCMGDESCKSSKTPMEAVEKQPGNDELHVIDDKYYGRQLLITFKEFTPPSEVEGLQISIVASKVQLDTDKKVPKNTHIKPHKKIRGKIFCPDKKYDTNTYIIDKKNKKIPLWPMEGLTYGSFHLFCDVKRTILIEGDFLRDDDDTWYFRTTTDPEQFFTSLPKGY